MASAGLMGIHDLHTSHVAIERHVTCEAPSLLSCQCKKHDSLAVGHIQHLCQSSHNSTSSKHHAYRMVLDNFRVLTASSIFSQKSDYPAIISACFMFLCHCITPERDFVLTSRHSQHWLLRTNKGWCQAKQRMATTQGHPPVDTKSEPLTMSADKGLVGTQARQRHSIL